MRVYKLEVMVLDFDQLGEEGVASLIHNARYLNHCSEPIVMACTSVDIGEWTDEHPLNRASTHKEAYKRLFEGK